MGRETFRVIPIPDCIPKNLYSSCNTGKLIDELVEVDGHLAVLVQENDDWLSLWIYLDNNGSDGFNWIKETIKMPCQWNELVNLDFKAIAGTELAVVKFIKTRQKQQHEWILYYNRKEKKYYRNKHESVLDVTGHTHAA
ncbi:hypothetical protein MKX03_013941, partial [Papaver bracteatum]